MKKILPFLACLVLTGCLGDSSTDNELIGQVKKVHHNTPMIFMNYNSVDVSLGVLRGGVGSMSTQDMWLSVPNSKDFAVLQHASETGELVKIKYNVARCTWYQEEETVTHAELAK